MQQNMNNIQFSDESWSILRYLYHKDANEHMDDIEEISNGLKIEKSLALLMVAQLMNEGYVARVLDNENNMVYALSLEGFELMKARKMH